MQKRKILLIGWDAADWNVARPLMDQGKMPGLKSLVDQGVSGNLATIRPVLSPMLWTSIGTGKRAWKHGIHGFIEPTPDGKSIRPITNLSRKTKAVWNILGQNGMKSNVVGWWPSHPAEPINGVMVSNHYQTSLNHSVEDWPLKEDCIHPKRLEEPLKELRLHRSELGNEHLLPFIPRLLEIDETKASGVDFCAKVIAQITSVQAAATACMQTEEWDFTAVYFDGIDHLNHMFMKYHPPKQEWVDSEEFELYKNVVETSYCYHDMMLQVLLSLAGDDTTVMLISDHGFETGRYLPRTLPNQPAGPANEHSPYGIFCLKGEGIRRGEQIHGASILDITPTLLHLNGLAVGRDMDGKALVNCFSEPSNVQFIDSWDEVEGDDGRHPPETQLNAVESRETIRQLVELGYVEEPDLDASKAVDQCIRELQINLVDAYMDGNRFADAILAAEKQWKRWPDDSRIGLQVVRSALSLGDVSKARGAYDQLLSSKLTLAQGAKQELDALDKVIQKRIEEGTVEAKAQGVAFEPAVPTQEERQKIQKLQRLMSDDLINMRHLEATLLLLEGSAEKAIQILKEIESVQAAHRPGLFNKIGDIYQELEDWDAAEGYYRKALSIYPNTHNAHLGLARVHLSKSRYFEAAASALASIELVFYNPRAHFVYATALTHLEVFELAEQTFLTAIGQSPNFPGAHERLAILYKKMGNAEKAAYHQSWAEKAHAHAESVRCEPFAGDQALLSFPEIIPHVHDQSRQGEDALVVVSGLPRSGTSLMMQMLHAAGVSIVTDAERSADESNPLGYFEDTRVKRLVVSRENEWLRECSGQAIKIVAPLLTNLPSELPARIVFMHRCSDEVVASQRKMLEREDRIGAIIEDSALVKVYSKHLDAVNALVAERSDLEILPVSYSDVLTDPLSVAERIAEFLGLTADPAIMASVVNLKLYRSRSVGLSD